MLLATSRKNHPVAGIAVRRIFISTKLSGLKVLVTMTLIPDELMETIFTLIWLIHN
jgi:hypothetical protein